MTPTEFFILLAVVWLAPTVPAYVARIIAAVMFGLFWLAKAGVLT